MNEVDVVRQLFTQRYGPQLLKFITNEEIDEILLNTSGVSNSVDESHEKTVVDMRFKIMDNKMKQILPQ